MVIGLHCQSISQVISRKAYGTMAEPAIYINESVDTVLEISSESAETHPAAPVILIEDSVDNNGWYELSLSS